MISMTAEFLAEITIFRGLNTSEVALVLHLLERETYEANEIIARQGDEARHLYIVETGECEVSIQTERNTDSHIIAKFGPADCLGEMALIDIQPRSATITARVSTSVLTLSNQAFLSIYESNPATYALILNNICREISRRLRQTNIRLATILATQKKDPSLS